MSYNCRKRVDIGKLQNNTHKLFLKSSKILKYVFKNTKCVFLFLAPVNSILSDIITTTQTKFEFRKYQQFTVKEKQLKPGLRLFILCIL